MNRRDVLRFLSAALVPRLAGTAEARPSGSVTVLRGNRTLAINLAHHAAVEERRPVLYLVQNITPEKLVTRLACSRARLDTQRFLGGWLQAAERERLFKASEEISASTFFIDDEPDEGNAGLVKRVEQFSAAHPAAVVVIDRPRRTLDACLRALKTVSARTGAAVIATAWS